MDGEYDACGDCRREVRICGTWSRRQTRPSSTITARNCRLPGQHGSYFGQAEEAIVVGVLVAVHAGLHAARGGQLAGGGKGGVDPAGVGVGGFGGQAEHEVEARALAGVEDGAVLGAGVGIEVVAAVASAVGFGLVGDRAGLGGPGLLDHGLVGLRTCGVSGAGAGEERVELAAVGGRIRRRCSCARGRAGAGGRGWGRSAPRRRRGPSLVGGGDGAGLLGKRRFLTTGAGACGRIWPLAHRPGPARRPATGVRRSSRHPIPAQQTSWVRQTVRGRRVDSDEPANGSVFPQLTRCGVDAGGGAASTPQVQAIRRFPRCFANRLRRYHGGRRLPLAGTGGRAGG